MRQLNRWDEVFSEEDTHETVYKLASWHLSEIIDTSVRERLLGLLGSGAAAVCSFDPDYATLSPHDAEHCRQILGFFQKRRDLVFEGVDRRAVALGKFRDSELVCLETNSVFKKWAAGNFSFLPAIETAFCRAQRTIARILGDVPSFDTLNLGFGPGATTQTKRKISSARSKLGQRFCCSEDLIPVLSELLAEMPAWTFSEESPETVLVSTDIHPCRLSFVPKNAKTDRGICTEPSLNVMLQRGIGQYMSRRLEHFGIDLRDQSKNKSLAREGSISGALATLDLSSASDLIATELVYHLLPIDWFFFLSYARSSRCEVEGEIVKLQKFSSMGNGFTFPLESLIFYALAEAGCARNAVVSVYGDDIIVPTESCSLVTAILEAAGFSINTEKSYSSGPFRESCGGDYLSGVDIRPYYLKDRLSGMSAFSLHNFYVRKEMTIPAALLLDIISESLMIWGPDGYGDGHLVGDYRRIPLNRDRGWSGHLFDTYILKPLRDFIPRSGDRVLPCYSIYASGPLFDFKFSRHLDPWGDRPLAFPSFRTATAFYRRGVLGVSIPGYKGYKRISVYKLTD